MPSFPRTRTPDTATPIWLPTGLRSRGHSGVIQLRATQQAGWTWQETWRLINARDADDASLMAHINYFWNRVVQFDVTHPLLPGSGLAPLGEGGGTPLVNGGAQVGGTVNTNGWPASTTNVVRAGDVIKFDGDTTVYQIHEDGSSDALGAVALSIIPNLRASPADNAPITTTGVTFNAMIWDRSRYDGFSSPSYFADMMVQFVEVLS